MKELEKHGFTKLCLESWYIKGAIAMLLRLRDCRLLDVSHLETPSRRLSANRKIYNKAIINMIIEAPDNVRRFIAEDFAGIIYTDHEFDKKGKLLKCRAEFATEAPRGARKNQTN